MHGPFGMFGQEGLVGQMSRLLRRIHRTLGIVVMPLLLVVALTGIYLNHSDVIYPLLRGTPYDERTMEQDPAAAPVDIYAATERATQILPREPINEVLETKYHGRPVFRFKKNTGDVIVVRDTGHYWVKTKYVRETFSPDGTRLDHKIYWGRIFREMHTGIVPGGRLGTILSDVIAGALLFFSLSGLLMRFGYHPRPEPSTADEVREAVRPLIKPRRIKLEEAKPRRSFFGTPAE